MYTRLPFSFFLSGRNIFTFTIAFTSTSRMLRLSTTFSMCICAISRIFSAFRTLRVYGALIEIISRMSSFRIADKYTWNREYRQNYTLRIYNFNTYKRTSCPILSREKNCACSSFFLLRAGRIARFPLLYTLEKPQFNIFSLC